MTWTASVSFENRFKLTVLVPTDYSDNEIATTVCVFQRG